YVMFSHIWNYPEGPGKEPLFKDVNAVKSVWNLSDKPLNNKLHNFCEETHRLGYSWAWSDTCCIDKTNTFILNQSLKSMYSWYANSAAMLVFLANIVHLSKWGDLMHSQWVTQARTLQELLSPKIILFYDSNNNVLNHKDSLEIKQELAVAIRILQKTIIMFSPENLRVHEKLHLALTHNVMVKEDIAYSLIGIFQSNIIPQYGEGADALGHLLEGIVDHTCEVTVLTWSGKSLSYHSCLPASISVYE
ncbi:hypothetical protein F5J12DRAFT_726832, partial [Pisolithus orientalis]|uniref:uncharacterized protein n=1 Tax=Pisolithus orientalis TaxID=936130 RepID=UPI002224C16F